ncbi:response regulator [Bilifractor porci]|uniref:Stage 0 sporulation protein A homolog n=1 Tax=Bilifractor porci TaxID=2606636 RepID=A0A7X2P8V4_9FIRM|nr:response regulator [Bilifractor porci]MST82365.1 response regulator [Bilifractor porci]
MRAVIVEDEQLMIDAFVRMGREIEDLSIVGKFLTAEDAVKFSQTNSYEAAFLDIRLPGMDGIECAKRMRQIMPQLLIVFISAYDSYLRETNQIGGDGYLLKPYNEEILRKTMDRLRLLEKRQRKNVYVKMFGRFTVMKDGVPVPLRGKAKEILALIMVNRGKEVSNEEIYTTIWESREYSNVNMKVYYNALKRLKDSLKKYGLENLIYSTGSGQMANVDLFDCDYYSWLDHRNDRQEQFEGEFLSEYSWGEYILADIIYEESRLEW